ncbi:MAG: hypothetical protein JW862_19740 [Anaerolineales bacterium]|nr:hypothetical protein [Anaerolineales bacterium]
MSNSFPKTTPSIYQICLQGDLMARWAEWLGSLALEMTPVESTPRRAVITVAVPDQAALRGMLNKLWDLNLALISIQPAKTGGQDAY